MVMVMVNILAVLFSIWSTMVVGAIQVQHPGQQHDHLKTVIVVSMFHFFVWLELGLFLKLLLNYYYFVIMDFKNATFLVFHK